MLGDTQQETLIQFMDAIAALCSPIQDKARIKALKEKVAVALAQVERDFPVSLQVKKSKSVVYYSCLLGPSYTFIYKIHLLVI